MTEREPPSAPQWDDSERPTKPLNPAARAAILVANWRACTAERQLALERLAESWSADASRGQRYNYSFTLNARCRRFYPIALARGSPVLTVEG